MPVLRIEDSFINPLKFHALDAVQPSKYVSRFMDDWAFRRIIQPWQEEVCYYQPWYSLDTINLQYTTNFAGMTLQLYDQEGILVDTVNFTTLQQDVLRPEYYIRQASLPLAGHAPGKYFLRRVTPGNLFYVTEPIEILPTPDPSTILLEDPNPTLLIEYSNYEPYQGIKFFAAPNLSRRVYGIIEYKKPSSKDTVYEDQPLNMSMVNSLPFDIYSFIQGGPRGVPPWEIKKTSRIFGCSELKIDGRLWTKNGEGQEFEEISAEDYPMAGWSIDLRDKLNRDGVITEDNVNVIGVAAAALIVDTQGFGVTPGPDTPNYQQIISVE